MGLVNYLEDLVTWRSAEEPDGFEGELEGTGKQPGVWGVWGLRICLYTWGDRPRALGLAA